MKREDLIKSKGYNVTKIQNELFRQLTDYLDQKGITRTQFAKELGVSKGYVSQVLNGDFDFKLSKLVELSLAIGKIPEILFIPINENQVEKKEAKLSDRDNESLFLIWDDKYSANFSNNSIWHTRNFKIEVKDNSIYETTSMD
jgi:transcriptional regulator with XRE-family HTH domain